MPRKAERQNQDAKDGHRTAEFALEKSRVLPDTCTTTEGIHIRLKPSDVLHILC